jgi:hypothetical protein
MSLCHCILLCILHVALTFYVQLAHCTAVNVVIRVSHCTSHNTQYTPCDMRIQCGESKGNHVSHQRGATEESLSDRSERRFE